MSQCLSYHCKIKCCIQIVLQCNKPTERKADCPNRRFEQLTRRNSSNETWRLTCTRCKYHANVDRLVKPFSIFNIFLLHTTYLIAIQLLLACASATPKRAFLDLPPLLQHPGKISHKPQTGHPCPYRLAAPIPLHCTLALRPMQAAMFVLGQPQPAACTLHKAGPLCDRELLKAKKLPGQHCKQPIP